MKKYLAIILLLIVGCQSGVKEDENLIENLMSQAPEKFDSLIKKGNPYQVQILYTRIHRDSNNIPSFSTFTFNHQPDQYFYPASTVKLPASILALEKLAELNIDPETVMLTDSAWMGQSAIKVDSSSENILPSVSHYIKKILLVSDNDAYNRLYEFLGQRSFNESMWSKGFTDTRMTHRLSIFLSQEENAHTNPVRFVIGDSTVYYQPDIINDTYIEADEPILLGNAHYSNDSLIATPMNFQFKNNYPLSEQHSLLKSLFFPEIDDRFLLNEEDRGMIWKYMSQWPSETTYPDYTDLPDNYVKFFIYGDGKEDINPEIRIFNKVGQAYGYLIDNAYIIDFENEIEFLLSAVIYTNANETLNDGKYEYDEIGFPFFSNLGKLIYEYELSNPKPIKPDLNHLKLEYDN